MIIDGNNKNTDIHKKRYFFTPNGFYLLFSVLLLVPVSCNYETAVRKSHTSNEIKVPPPVSLDLDRIKKRGSIVALIDNSTTSYFVYKGRPMGYEYELLRSLAQELDLRLELKIVAHIEDAFIKLNNGEGDIIAHNLVVTNERKQFVAFTEYHKQVSQVLVQRKPDNWQQLKLHEIDNQLIKNPIQLEGKTVYVPQGSVFANRLQNLSNEIGGHIQIEEVETEETENLIAKVANGEIDYTVADENVANVNSSYYPNIDVNTAISFPQKIAWAVRKNSPDLLEAINSWTVAMKKNSEYYFIYDKYFKNPKASIRHLTSSFSSLNSRNISPYDELIREAADQLGWDWRLLAAQMYQESRFDTQAQSMAGAVGLMQIMPGTAEIYGVDDRQNPNQSMQAGVAYLLWLNKLWKKYVPDNQERVKFVLASYNVGQGHVLDARRLARKYGRNPNKWDNSVAFFLEQKSLPDYYNDPVVFSGYCRGNEPVNYVTEIINRYQTYRQLISSI